MADPTPDTLTGSLEKHGIAVRSLFPELWEAPETEESNAAVEDETLSSPETEKGNATEEVIATVLSSDTTLSNDSSKVAQMRESLEKSATRSQLLNLNDFHMQQRAHRRGDLEKKRESLQGLHSFHAAPPQQTLAKEPPKKTQQDLKAADRAAMASYMFLRQQTAPAKKSPSGPMPPPLSSKREEGSIPQGAAKKWRTSPGGKTHVIVTDVDEFYKKQHAIHLEDERKKREILHISDNRDLSPDMTSPSPKRYTRPALDSFGFVGSQSFSNSYSMDDTVDRSVEEKVESEAGNLYSLDARLKRSLETLFAGDKLDDDEAELPNVDYSIKVQDSGDAETSASQTQDYLKNTVASLENNAVAEEVGPSSQPADESPEKPFSSEDIAVDPNISEGPERYKLIESVEQDGDEDTQPPGKRDQCTSDGYEEPPETFSSLSEVPTDEIIGGITDEPVEDEELGPPPKPIDECPEKQASAEDIAIDPNCSEEAERHRLTESAEQDGDEATPSPGGRDPGTSDGNEEPPEAFSFLSKVPTDEIIDGITDEPVENEEVGPPTKPIDECPEKQASAEDIAIDPNCSEEAERHNLTESAEQDGDKVTPSPGKRDPGTSDGNEEPFVAFSSLSSIIGEITDEPVEDEEVGPPPKPIDECPEKQASVEDIAIDPKSSEEAERHRLTESAEQDGDEVVTPSPGGRDPGTSAGNEEPFMAFSSLSEVPTDEIIGEITDEPVENEEVGPPPKPIDECPEKQASVEDIAIDPNCSEEAERHRLTESAEQDGDEVVTPSPGGRDPGTSDGNEEPPVAFSSLSEMPADQIIGGITDEPVEDEEVGPPPKPIDECPEKQASAEDIAVVPNSSEEAERHRLTESAEQDGDEVTPSPGGRDPGTSDGNEEPPEAFPSLSELLTDESVSGTADEPVEDEEVGPPMKLTDESTEEPASAEDIAVNPNISEEPERHKLIESVEKDGDEATPPPGGRDPGTSARNDEPPEVLPCLSELPADEIIGGVTDEPVEDEEVGPHSNPTDESPEKPASAEEIAVDPNSSEEPERNKLTECAEQDGDNETPSPGKRDPGTSDGNDEPPEVLPSLSELLTDEIIGGITDEPVEDEELGPPLKPEDECPEKPASTDNIVADPDVMDGFESYNLTEGAAQAENEDTPWQGERDPSTSARNDEPTEALPSLSKLLTDESVSKTADEPVEDQGETQVSTEQPAVADLDTRQGPDSHNVFESVEQDGDEPVPPPVDHDLGSSARKDEPPEVLPSLSELLTDESISENVDEPVEELGEMQVKAEQPEKENGDIEPKVGDRVIVKLEAQCEASCDCHQDSSQDTHDKRELASPSNSYVREILDELVTSEVAAYKVETHVDNMGEEKDATKDVGDRMDENTEDQSALSLTDDKAKTVLLQSAVTKASRDVATVEDEPVVSSSVADEEEADVGDSIKGLSKEDMEDVAASPTRTKETEAAVQQSAVTMTATSPSRTGNDGPNEAIDEIIPGEPVIATCSSGELGGDQAYLETTEWSTAEEVTLADTTKSLESKNVDASVDRNDNSDGPLHSHHTSTSDIRVGGRYGKPPTPETPRTPRDDAENEGCSENESEEDNAGNLPDIVAEEPVLAIAAANEVDAYADSDDAPPEASLLQEAALLQDAAAVALSSPSNDESSQNGVDNILNELVRDTAVSVEFDTKRDEHETEPSAGSKAEGHDEDESETLVEEDASKDQESLSQSNNAFLQSSQAEKAVVKESVMLVSVANEDKADADCDVEGVTFIDCCVSPAEVEDEIIAGETFSYAALSAETDGDQNELETEQSSAGISSAEAEDEIIAGEPFSHEALSGELDADQNKLEAPNDVVEDATQIVEANVAEGYTTASTAANGEEVYADDVSCVATEDNATMRADDAPTDTALVQDTLAATIVSISEAPSDELFTNMAAFAEIDADTDATIRKPYAIVETESNGDNQSDSQNCYPPGVIESFSDAPGIDDQIFPSVDKAESDDNDSERETVPDEEALLTDTTVQIGAFPDIANESLPPALKGSADSLDSDALLIEELLADGPPLGLLKESDGGSSKYRALEQNNEEGMSSQVDDHFENIGTSEGPAPESTNKVISSDVGLDFTVAGKSEYRDESTLIVSSTSQGDSHPLTDGNLMEENVTEPESFICAPSAESTVVEENVTEPESFICAPSAGSTDEPVEPIVEVDYKGVDYRGFVFVVHKMHGLMLLHCTRKAKKGPHFQLPGGHVDEPEFLAAAESSRDAQTQLLLAARAGAARELYEETGMDIRYQLDRLEPAALRSDVTFNKHGKPILKCELKHRLYFFLPVSDEDFWSTEREDSEEGRVHPLCAEGKHLMLKVSIEHSGWTFEKNPNKSAELLAVHSGGTGATALRMSMARGGTGMEEMKSNEEEKGDKHQPDVAEPGKEPVTKTQAAARAPPLDLLSPPEQTNILAKLFSCCNWSPVSE